MTQTRQSTAGRTLRRSRGFALAGTMMALLILLSLMIVGVAGSGMFTATSNGIQMAGARVDPANAFTLAESGADYARLWLIAQPYPPASSGNAPFVPFTDINGQPEWGAAMAGGTPPRAVINYPDAAHRFSVTIYPIIGSSGSNVKNYLIESVGISGASQAVLHVEVQQVNFAKYAYFDDKDHPSSGVNYWGYPATFQGPYHSNNSNGQALAFRWADTDATPMFLSNQRDSFSFSGVPLWQGPGTAESDFEHLTAGGQQNMTSGWQTNLDGSIKKDAGNNPIPNSPRIPLPATNYAPEYAALGQSVPNPAASPPPGIPTTAGVTLSPNGGIFIHVDTNPATNQPDDVQTMTFSALADSQGKKTIQQIVITQPVAQGAATVSQMQRVTINPGTNTTTLETSLNGGSTWTATQSQTGATNGAIFSDGNIGGTPNSSGNATGALSGIIADNVVDAGGDITHYNSLSLTTDIANGKNIYILNSLKYNTPRNTAVAEALDTPFLRQAGTMRLVGNLVEIPETTRALLTNRTLEIDASVFAKDSFMCENTATSPQYNLTLEGGVIETNVAYMYHYTEHYNYDTRMADRPPPFFPTTGNKYSVISWQRVSATLE